MIDQLKQAVTALRRRIAEWWTPERRDVASRYWFWVKVVHRVKRIVDWCVEHHDLLQAIWEAFTSLW